MKTITAILLILTASISMAQKERNESERDKLTATGKAEKRTEKLSELLSLSDEQTEKIYQLNLNHIQKMDELKVERDALKQKHEEAKELIKNEMNSILSAEQKIILAEKREEMRQKRQDKREKCKEDKKE